MTFKNQGSVHFCLCAPTYPLQTQRKIPESTGPKFTKLLHDVEGSSEVKVFHPFCDLPKYCRMTARKMKMGCVKFRQHAPQIGYHSNVP